MKSESEIRERLGEWSKVKFSEFDHSALASIICELQWVLGDNVDILANNKLWRAQEEALRKELSTDKD